MISFVSLSRRRLLRPVLLSASLLMLTGCGDYTGKEKTHPLFVKAESCKNSGDAVEAVKYYQEFLNLCPKSSVTHYEIAGVYSDSLDEPFKAIYHYTRYIELGGTNAADQESVRKFIQAAKKKAFQQLSKQFESEDTAKAYAEILRVKKRLDEYVDYSGKLRTKLEKYIAYSEQLKKQNSEMRELLRNPVKRAAASLPEPSGTPKETTSGALEKNETAEKNIPLPEQNATVQDPKKPNDEWTHAKPVAASPGSTAGSEIKQTAPQPEKKPDNQTAGAPEGARGKIDAKDISKSASYTVKSGDTLSKIARELYGHSKYYPLILKANAEKVGPGGSRLRPGQILVIPPLPAGGVQ